MHAFMFTYTTNILTAPSILQMVYLIWLTHTRTHRHYLSHTHYTNWIHWFSISQCFLTCALSAHCVSFCRIRVCVCACMCERTRCILHCTHTSTNTKWWMIECEYVRVHVSMLWMYKACGVFSVFFYFWKNWMSCCYYLLHFLSFRVYGVFRTRLFIVCSHTVMHGMKKEGSSNIILMMRWEFLSHFALSVYMYVCTHTQLYILLYTIKFCL
jgi:hypothetical protein